ncbi:hypothetical protein [Sphingomonas sp. TX0522]|uniref:hypothetical protein n=1 Tax=Sphingomonas sp. TX0522 TaxID=2479205 RepID=UPI0018E02515|nr:hypothetical protein [Sphingomonas sp. TX0522]MBI0533056.1 hypothetical protein [Sphingomonas sp. TX0522]
MFQPDLFAGGTIAKPSERPARTRELDVPAILDRLTAVCERPRYNFMVLNLIAQASAATGSAGPFVRMDGQRITIRDWLCDAMAPVARRDPRRLAFAEKVRSELIACGRLPQDPDCADAVIAEAVRQRIRRSGRTNVSRAVSELVRAGFVRRHYQGYRVDHHNRGAQRHAVYTITEETRRGLSRPL